VQGAPSLEGAPFFSYGGDARRSMAVLKKSFLQIVASGGRLIDRQLLLHRNRFQLHFVVQCTQMSRVAVAVQLILIAFYGMPLFRSGADFLC
jgi:hypothetical protein